MNGNGRNQILSQSSRYGENVRVTITGSRFGGRLVGGDLYQGFDSTMSGETLIIKTGINKGRPAHEFYAAWAIEKTTQRWQDEDWGKVLVSEGQRLCGSKSSSPNFKWKVYDGDSTIVDQKGKRPVDRAGYQGNWVIATKSKSMAGAAKLFNVVIRQKVEGQANVVETPCLDFKRGDYGDFRFEIVDNNSDVNPGLMLRLVAVSYRCRGEPIVFAEDTADMGFGNADNSEDLGVDDVIPNDLNVPRMQSQPPVTAQQQHYNPAPRTFVSPDSGASQKRTPPPPPKLVKQLVFHQKGDINTRLDQQTVDEMVNDGWSFEMMVSEGWATYM